MKSAFRLVLFACLLPLVAHAQDAWRPFPQDVTMANLWSVAYNDRAHTLVAVGDQGTILSFNYDDQAWLPRVSGVSGWLVGVGYGAGRFVAVGDGGVILTSDDAGVTWTPRASATTTRLNAAAYGNGLWLVVGERGTVLVSTDGATWTARPPLGSGFLRALAFGLGGFFLIGGEGGALYSTTDGFTFDQAPRFTSENIEGATISNSRLWIAGSNGLLASATALRSWTLVDSRSAATFRGVAGRDSDDAAAVGEFYAATFTAGFARTVSRPQFLATAVTRGQNELVAVGFGGGIARAGVTSSPTILTGFFSSATATHGTEVRLVGAAGAFPAVRYEWRNGRGELLPGATGLELVLPRVTSADSGNYTLDFIQANGARNSASMRLEVVPDGLPEVRDGNFLAAFGDRLGVVAVQPDGKVLVAASLFLTPVGDTTFGLARLTADGSLDPTFRAGSGLITAANSINALFPQPDGKIYVTGSFTNLDGLPRAGLARLLPNGAVDPNFVPDPGATVFSRLIPRPDGRIYFETAFTGSRQIKRLLATGAIDPTFAPIVDHQLVNVDAQDRVLAFSIAELGDTGHLLRRFRTDGTRDTTYTETPLAYIPGLVDGISDSVINANGLYTITYSWGKFGRLNSFAHYLPDGGVDPNYRSPPGQPYPNTSGLRYSPFFFPDGSVMLIRSPYGDGAYVAEFYDPAGRLDRSRHATMRDESFYRVLALAPDGSLIAAAALDRNSPDEAMVRIRPRAGRIGRLTNLSARSFVDPAADPLILGLITLGSGETRGLIRAIGPTLANYQVPDALSDPRLALTRDGATIANNDQWDAALAPRFTAVGAFPLNSGSRDAALESAIGAGSYTAVVSPAPGSSPGTALAELYESADDPFAPRRFINASARGPVTPERSLIVGFGITGDVPVTVLIRCAGPALTKYNVTNVLANPSLTLHRAGDDAILWENDDWSAGDFAPRVAEAATATGAFKFDGGSKDSALLVTLPPGTYSAVAAGVNGSSGTALVEIYEVR